jgi:hypothetical protein
MGQVEGIFYSSASERRGWSIGDDSPRDVAWRIRGALAFQGHAY